MFVLSKWYKITSDREDKCFKETWTIFLINKVSLLKIVVTLSHCLFTNFTIVIFAISLSSNTHFGDLVYRSQLESSLPPNLKSYKVTPTSVKFQQYYTRVIGFYTTNQLDRYKPTQQHTNLIFRLNHEGSDVARWWLKFESL